MDAETHSSIPDVLVQAPAVMKEWIDTVMSKSARFANKLRNSESLYTWVKEEAFAQEERAIYDFGTHASISSVSKCNGLKLLPIFEVHQFDYKTEVAKQALLVEYLQYVTKEHHGTLKDTEDWFIERAQSMKGASGNKS